MGAKGYKGLVAFGLLAMTLSACGSSSSSSSGNDTAQVEIQSDDSDIALPARYGLYVVQDGELGRLDAEKSVQVQTWDSRSSLQPDVSFIIFDRSLADRSMRLGDTISLRKVAHVRNDVAASGAATPLQKDTWVVADSPEFVVPLDFQPIHGSPEMVRVIPTRPLAPGLYSFQFRLGESAAAGRFGVQWSKIDKAQYASANCVDRYAGSPPVYKLCADLSAQQPQQQISQQPLQQQPLQQQQFQQPQSLQQRPLQQQPWPQQNTFQQQLIQPYKTPPAVPMAPEQPAPKQQALQQQAPQQQAPQQPTAMPSAQGLKLRDVQAARNVDQGVAILTVEGTIVNTSKEARRVPPLMATVRDTKGTELDRWTFTAENPDLPPGGSTGFRTETIYPTNQSTNVAVTFAADSTAQAQ
jgi:hypothetical protein